MNEPLKAWWVEEFDSEWGFFVHAETVSKAKYAYKRGNPSIEDCEWVDIRALRRPKYDGLAFTDENMPGMQVIDDDGDPWADEWLDYCDCELCKAAKSQRGRR